MKLLKSGLLIALLVLFCAGTANAQPFSWYFGSNPNQDYTDSVTGPLIAVFIPATLVTGNANELPPGGIVGAGNWGTRNDVPDVFNDDWWLSFAGYPEGDLIPNHTYEFDIYALHGYDYINNSPITLPEGTYSSRQEYDKLNYWADSTYESLISITPQNNFTVTVRNQAESAVPEPATMLLLGMGMVGLAIKRRIKT